MLYLINQLREILPALFGALSPVNSPFLVIPSGLQWTAFNGGANLFTAKKAKHEFNAAKFDLARNSNDILSDTARLYYDLVLQDVLLQIRIKAVQTSEALLAKTKYSINLEQTPNWMYYKHKLN
jgi:hypothetical protein